MPEKQVLEGPTMVLKNMVLVPPFCSPASPLLSPGQPAALPLPLLPPPLAFDQSWPLCHSCPSGGSSPSPTTTLPAGRPSLMHTHGCKHTGTNAGSHTHTCTHTNQAPPHKLISKETARGMRPKT